MKKELENKKSSIIVLSCSKSSSDESEKELPIENTEELKKYLQTSDESTKKTPPKKSKKLIKKRKTSSDNSDDQDKPSKIIKKPKKSAQKDSPKKTLVKGDDFKKLQKKAKKLGATSLDYSKRKNNKYMVEYKGKKIHFSSAHTEDFIIHKDPDRRDKYRVKAMKITNKNGELTYQLPTYPIIGLSNF